MQKLGKMFPDHLQNLREFDGIFGHKNLTTQHKIDQSCTLFSKARIRQSLLKMPNAAHPLVPFPRQVWLQSSLVRAVGIRGFWSMHSQSFQFLNIVKD